MTLGTDGGPARGTHRATTAEVGLFEPLDLWVRERSRFGDLPSRDGVAGDGTDEEGESDEGGDVAVHGRG